jgi:hypothetical protein
MAKLFPDIDKTRVIFASAAEEQFYNQCRTTLAGDWRVYHSCTLSTVEKNDGLKDNEIDFVCYHPRYGVVVIEVKGGRIKRDAETARFFSVNRHGESFEIKDPFNQVLVWKSRFLRFLKANQIKVPVSHGVCFPSVAESEFPDLANMANEIIIGRERIKDLGSTLKTIVQKSQPEKYLQFSDVAADLDKMLVGTTFTSKLYLRDYLDSHEDRMKDIESIHETLITPIASSSRLGIEGEAGTGKTMLALLLAKRFRDEGKDILILASNGLLNLLLKDEVGQGIVMKTYAEIAGDFGVNLLIPPKEYQGEKEDWIQYVAPETLKNAIAKSPKRFDVVICDEAQDVQPFWWEAIEGLLKSPPEKSNDETDDQAQEVGPHFYLFFDRSQGVFGAGHETHFTPEDVLPVKSPYFPLVHNYRTTREIAAFSRAFRTGENVLHSHCGRIGYVPEIILYDDAEDGRRLLGRLFQKLLKEEGLAPEEITMLSGRNPSARDSILYKTDEIIRYPIHRLAYKKTDTHWRQARPPSGTLSVTTISGFKGMETPVGILMNISEYNLPADNPIMASLIYVAATRAKHMLYIFLKRDDKAKTKAFVEALSHVKAAGSMVIEGSQSDFEFCGTVTHYNPQRVGWLTVEDPAFELNSIMFFPHDVQKSVLKNIKVGSKIKFRPRVEGQTTIACDLSPTHEFLAHS